MRYSQRLQNIILILATLAFLGLSIVAQFRYDAVWKEQYVPRAPIHKFVMPAPIVRYFSFGFDNVLVDYYWLNAVQDFTKWDRKDIYYPEYFRIIATLDPHFEYPFMFAALTIPSKLSPESLSWLADIAAIGISANPESWEIPFYTGLEFFYIGKDYERAATYLAIAANIPDAPFAVHNVYALFQLRTSTDYELSRSLFMTVLDTAESEESKRMAREHILLIDFIETVDRASGVYESIHGEYPKTIEDLTKSGIVIIPPELGERFPLKIDQNNGKATLR